MNIIPPIFAVGVGDLIGWAVVLLFLIVPAIGQILAKMRQVQPPAGGARPPRPAPVPVNVAGEIEVFMRRVMGQQGSEKKPPVRPKPAPLEKPVQAEVVVVAPVGGQVGKHVQKYLDSQEFTLRADRLGGEVAQADEQYEQHAHQVFDHKLGQFGTPAVEAAPPSPAVETSDLSGATAVEIPPTFAAGLAAMLSNVESVSQAIVLSEIIHRPEERWTE